MASLDVESLFTNFPFVKLLIFVLMSYLKLKWQFLALTKKECLK